MSQINERAHVCPECNGTGLFSTFPDHCDNCDGCGWLDEHGEPVLKEETSNEDK